MKTIVFFISLISLTYSSASNADKTIDMINMFYSEESKDSVTATVCRMAIDLSNGDVTKETCKRSLPNIKKTCSDLALTYFGEQIKTPENARKLVDNLIPCAVVLQLNHEAYLTDEGIRFKPISKVQ